MKWLKNAVILSLSLSLLGSLLPATAFGTPLTELTPALKTSFDLMAAGSEGSTRNKLNSLYIELSVLKKQDDNREANLRSLHESNERNLEKVRREMKELNLTAVQKLEEETKEMKQRYQPLFDQYTALNNRIALAKKLKDKDLNAVLRTQADVMKITVQSARQAIREKELQLRTARDTRAKKTAAVRKTLEGIRTPQTSIKSQKSVISALNKRLTADWSDFKAAIRKQNGALASQSLASIVSQYRQLAETKQKLIELEQKVAGVLTAAANQLSS